MNKTGAKQGLKEKRGGKKMAKLVTEANKIQLNDKQLQAIDLILIGNTNNQVAKYVGVNRSIAYKYLK